MTEQLAIIGIDSLDPQILLKYRKELPTFSSMISESELLFLESTFPVDSIPAWATIYSGLNPDNHGFLYSYDIFDPNLSDLHKLNSTSLKNKTFWDMANSSGYRSLIFYPMFVYPAWEINGVMICKSPFDKKIDDIQTEISLDHYPHQIKNDYYLPDKILSIYGGYPGRKNLEKWANTGYNSLIQEFRLSEKIFSSEKWDILHIYFSLLDIIQHRLWRFFDDQDPIYSYDPLLNKKILDFYKLFDNFLKQFIENFPNAKLIVLSDHGHTIRPMKTININEILRKEGYLKSKKNISQLKNMIKKIVLELISKYDLEHSVIKIISCSGYVTKKSKVMLSSKNQIDNGSVASLSSFAGIKSYSFGGIEINRSNLSNKEYEEIRNKIITSLKTQKNQDGKFVFNWIKKREDIYNQKPGKYNSEIFPDIVFELQSDYCVGWNLFSNIFEKSYDHKVASGGHAKQGVILLRNIDRPTTTKAVTLSDITPTILDLLNINQQEYPLDGKSIF